MLDGNHCSTGRSPIRDVTSSGAAIIGGGRAGLHQRLLLHRNLADNGREDASHCSTYRPMQATSQLETYTLVVSCVLDCSGSIYSSWIRTSIAPVIIFTGHQSQPIDTINIFLLLIQQSFNSITISDRLFQHYTRVRCLFMACSPTSHRIPHT